MGYKAFLIGVNTHGLQYSESDTELMSVCLAQHGYEVIKPYKKERRSILEQFEEMLDKCDKTDTVIFYFSGHALLSKGKLRLVLDDSNNPIRISEITEPLEECRATNKLIILDCCNSGAASANLKLHLTNTMILTACTRLEKSQEIDDFKAGFFTYQIHQALTDKSTEICVDQKIQISQLDKWLKNAAEQHNVKHSVNVPIPNLYGYNAKNNFAVATCESATVSKNKQWILTEPQKEQLVDSLLACKSIKKHDIRDTVFQKLPEHIYNAIEVHRDSRVHVSKAVDTCLDYPGGIEALIQAVRRFEKGTWQEQELLSILEDIKRSQIKPNI
jgi:hypothetical protein